METQKRNNSPGHGPDVNRKGVAKKRMALESVVEQGWVKCPESDEHRRCMEDS